MPGRWAAVEALVRDLGAVRSASFAARADSVSYAAIETAMAEATEAVLSALDTPRDGSAIVRARDAIEVAADVLAALDAELVRSRRMRARAAELRGRAKELVAQARKASAG